MNLGAVIKEEILSKRLKDFHCRKAFLSGLIRGSGTLYEKEGDLGLEFKTDGEKVADLAVEYLKSVCEYEVREVDFSEDKLNKKEKFYINVYGEGALDALQTLGVIQKNNDEISVSYDMFDVCEERDCCIKAFLRGLFVSCGGCTVPSNGSRSQNYHLEMTFSHYTTALSVSEKLRSYGVFAKITRRKESFVLYIKSAEEIKDFIALLAAPVAVLKLTDIMIERELSNNSNRQANCDIGNVNKQVEASAKQIEAINKIEKIKGLSFLKKDLFDVASIRKLYPDNTLQELAERLGVSKSCLNHRLRKIVCIANEL